MSVIFVNCFEVPAGSEDDFLELWKQVNTYMQAKPGYLGHHLHKSVRPEDTYGFVNVATWESTEAWSAAHDEGLISLVSQPQWRPYPNTPGLYEIIHTGAADDRAQPGDTATSTGA